MCCKKFWRNCLNGNVEDVISECNCFHPLPYILCHSIMINSDFVLNLCIKLYWWERSILVRGHVFEEICITQIIELERGDKLIHWKIDWVQMDRMCILYMLDREKILQSNIWSSKRFPRWQSIRHYKDFLGYTSDINDCSLHISSWLLNYNKSFNSWSILSAFNHTPLKFT